MQKSNKKRWKILILQNWSKVVLITNKTEQNFLLVIFSHFRDHREVYWPQILPLCVQKRYHENHQISMVHTYIERIWKVPLFLTWKCLERKLHNLNFILYICNFSIEPLVFAVEQFEFSPFHAKKWTFSKMWILKIHTSLRKYHSK